MDYQYAGSASYPRFDEELTKVAEVFGGIKTERLKERETNIPEGSVAWWFGVLSSDNSKEPKFVFPNGTNETLLKWFNDIYGDFTSEETEQIWHCFSEHPEIQEISRQIWYELESLVDVWGSWDIC